MAYPGGVPSGTYGFDYNLPPLYQPVGHQQTHPTDAYSQPLWDDSLHRVNAQHTQHMSHVQQSGGAQAQNEVMYHQQQQQYASLPNMQPPTGYHQVPIHHQQQYPPYVSQQQHNFPQYEQPITPESHFPYQQITETSSRIQQSSQPYRAPNSHYNVTKQVSHNREQAKTPPSTIQSKVQAATPHVDAPMLLITLAEEYFAAAQKLGPAVARSRTDDFVDEYQRLIATGLGCLEASFKKSRLAPRLEAKVRLRYAAVLFEETENYMEAETALSQGIILCEQNRFLDLKYSMQFLLAQLVFVKNPKASLKSLDRHCTDLEAYRYHSWEYIFRLLRASLSLQSSKASDIQVALHDLRYISSLSNQHEDYAIFLFASLMEIMAHLSAPGPESVEQVHTALAAAWSYQLDAQSQIPQLVVLTHMLDVACSLLYGLPAQTELKQKAMEEAFRNYYSTSSNELGDSIAIPFHPVKAQQQLISQDSRAILGIAEDGMNLLMISSLNNNDTFALIYLLSGIALMHNNCADGKAAQYLKQGLLSVQDSNASRRASGPLPVILAKAQWREILACYFLIYSVFCSASTSDWNAARDGLEELGKALHGLGDGLKVVLAQFHIYLTGVYFQGAGELESALRMFQDPKLRLPEKYGLNMNPEEKIQSELALLSLLNTLWIQQADPRHDAARNTAMIDKLEPLCANHVNKNIETAFKLVKATVPTEPPTSGVKIKNYLGSALEAAKSTSNKQFLCITLGVMCDKFFVGVVGSQADKAGRAAVFQAKRTRNNLWMSVTNGMLAENLELQGQHDEAEAARQEARRLGALVFPEPS